MVKTLSLLLGLCLMALASLGCGKRPAPLLLPGRGVVDMAGRQVRVPIEVKRVACLEVLGYEKLFLLGADDRVAMMIKTNAPWMKQTNPKVAAIQQLSTDANIEEMLRQHVDVVFRSYGYPNSGKIETLAQMGVPIIVSQPVGRIDSIEAFVESRKRMLRLYAQVLGPSCQARAEQWCAYHDRMVAMVRARTDRIPPEKRVRLFHVRGPEATQTQGLNSNTYWYGEIAGANMVVKQSILVGKGPVPIEDILKWNPEVINIGRQYSADLVTRDPRWAGVKAVRTGRVQELPEGVFFWDGSTEGVLLMLYLAKELYPERFADLDLRREIRAYYAQFYRYALSDRELTLMLQGKGPDGERRNKLGT